MPAYPSAILICGAVLASIVGPAVVRADDAAVVGTADATVPPPNDASVPPADAPVLLCLGISTFPFWKTFGAPSNVELRYSWFQPDDGERGLTVPVVPDHPVLWYFTSEPDSRREQVPVIWREVGENQYVGRPAGPFVQGLPGGAYAWSYRQSCLYQDADGGAPILATKDENQGAFTAGAERDDTVPEAPVLLAPEFGVWETQAETAHCGAFTRCSFKIPLGERRPVERQRLDLGDRVRLFRGDAVVDLSVAYFSTDIPVSPTIEGVLVTGGSCSLKQLSSLFKKVALANLDGLQIRVVDAAGNMSAPVAIPSEVRCSSAPAAETDAGVPLRDAGLASLDAGHGSLDLDAGLEPLDAAATARDDLPNKAGRADESGCQLQHAGPSDRFDLAWLALALSPLLLLRMRKRPSEDLVR